MSDRNAVSVPSAPSTNGRAEPSDGSETTDSVIQLLEEWLADESGYDEEAWPELKDALDRDRLSARKLFRG